MKRTWLIPLLLAALLLWWGLSRRDTAPEIHFSPVVRTTIESTISTNGKVEPAEWAAARTAAAGIVSNIEVQRGQKVKQGQPLITLDMRLTKTELEGALARKQQAEAEATSVNQGGKAATLASLNDSLQTAKTAVAVAERNLDSLQRLYKQQAATKIQVDEAKDALDRARLQEQSVENQRRTLVTASDKTEALARINDAQAAVDLASARLQYGVVKAPLSGTLYQFDIKDGAYLQPGELVALVGNLDRVKVLVYVDEPDLGRVSMGMPVSITWDGLPGKKWTGHVEQLPTEIIALGTRTVGEVTTVVDNPDHDLLPGVTVYVTIVSSVVKDATSVPKAALRSMQGENGVYALRGDHLNWTPVKVGSSDINNVQILSGLNLGDKVADRVIDPSDAELRNGLRVKAQFR